MSIDIHHNGDGSNGIIIGLAGSGKSELIYTILFSLALSYNPYQITFNLVDFSEKIAEEIIRLPHCQECLTELNHTAIKDFVSMLKSEVNRRESLFKKYKLKSIYQYHSAQKHLQIIGYFCRI